MIMRKEQWILLIFLILYVVGLFGQLTSYKEGLLQYTPMVLLITIGGTLLSVNWSKPTKNWLLAGIAIATCCFLIEMIGVNTGVIFGEYEYLDNLGFKLWNTPLLIGGNWLLLTIGSYALIQSVVKKEAVRIVLAALVMVLVDVLIEGVAPAMRMWSFDGYPPMQNFVAWFIVSLIVLYFWGKLKVASNVVTRNVIYILIVFFGGINVINLSIA